MSVVIVPRVVERVVWEVPFGELCHGKLSLSLYSTLKYLQFSSRESGTTTCVSSRLVSVKGRRRLRDRQSRDHLLLSV